MDPILEMIIYSIIPIILLPIAFLIWLLMRAKFFQKISKAHDEK